MHLIDSLKGLEAKKLPLRRDLKTLLYAVVLEDHPPPPSLELEPRPPRCFYVQAYGQSTRDSQCKRVGRIRRRMIY